MTNQVMVALEFLPPCVCVFWKIRPVDARARQLYCIWSKTSQGNLFLRCENPSIPPGPRRSGFHGRALPLSFIDASRLEKGGCVHFSRLRGEFGYKQEELAL